MNSITKDIPTAISRRDTSNACVILILAALTFLCDRWTEATTDEPTPKSSPIPVVTMKSGATILTAANASLPTPLEFFERLPAKETIKLKGIVVGFLYGGAGDN